MRLSDVAGSKLFWLYLLLLTVYILSLNDPFFWDTISQSSKRPDWFFRNDFKTFLLPPELDSGHPPAFNWYIAIWWKTFGKSLLVSHLAMLPFLAIIIIYMHRVALIFLDAKYVSFGLIFFLSDPTFLAQISLVSADVVLIAGFILGFWALVSKKPMVFLLAGSVLLFVSLRGSLIWGALVLMQVRDWWLMENRRPLKSAYSILSVFVPFGLFVGYLWFHYSQTGWSLFSPNPNWADHREINDMQGFLRSGGVILWRILDFGRIFWLIVLLLLLFRMKLMRAIDPILRMQFIFLSITTIPVFLIWSNPVSCRYFLPHLFLLSLMMGSVLIQPLIRSRSLLVAVSLLFLWSGHFWKYPDHIAQVWDGSLAYKPFFRLHQETIDFINRSGIDAADVGTGFPMKGSRGHQNLKDYEYLMPAYDLGKDEYILYNSVSNDFDKPQLEELQSEDWLVIFERRSWLIRSTLYKRKP